MSKSLNRKTVGDWKGFPTTHWTDIFEARSDDEPRRQEALGELLARYWRPIYCYLLCKGCTHEAAEDLTQSFFHEVVLGRGLFQKADRARGRLRTFVLVALNRYVVGVHRAEVRKQRMPVGGLVRLERIERLTTPEAVQSATPVEVFNYLWGCTLLDQVVEEVANECREKGNAIHWELFRARVLQPIMNDAEPPSLAFLCQKYSIPDKATVSNMIFSVKRRFRTRFRRQVGLLVASDNEVDDEIGHFMKVFSKRAARF
jgi:DNA-directed RNA polymerase specialized sigma24 family protein